MQREESSFYRIEQHKRNFAIYSEARFLQYLADYLQGKPVHPAVRDYLTYLGNDLQLILEGTMQSIHLTLGT